MRDYNINGAPLAFLSILDIRMEEEIGEHGIMEITGYIEDSKEEEYLSLLTGDVWEKVEMVGKDGGREILFWGIVTDFSIHSEYHQKQMTLRLTTGSWLMDQKKHLRSYQNSNITYEQIFRSIGREYPDADIVFRSSLEDAAGNLVLQYYETDWQFLKRLAGRKHKFLTAESHIKGIKLTYDLPVGRKAEFPENQKYTVKKELDDYRRRKSSGLSSLYEEDALVYIVQCRDNHRIGDFMIIQGKNCTFTK